jgi:hypothetical protein
MLGLGGDEDGRGGPPGASRGPSGSRPHAGGQPRVQVGTGGIMAPIRGDGEFLVLDDEDPHAAGGTGGIGSGGVPTVPGTGSQGGAGSAASAAGAGHAAQGGGGWFGRLFNRASAHSDDQGNGGGASHGGSAVAPASGGRPRSPSTGGPSALFGPRVGSATNGPLRMSGRVAAAGPVSRDASFLVQGTGHSGTAAGSPRSLSHPTGQGAWGLRPGSAGQSRPPVHSRMGQGGGTISLDGVGPEAEGLGGPGTAGGRKQAQVQIRRGAGGGGGAWADDVPDLDEEGQQAGKPPHARQFKRPGGFADPGGGDPSQGASAGGDAGGGAKPSPARQLRRPGGFSEPSGEDADQGWGAAGDAEVGGAKGGRPFKRPGGYAEPGGDDSYRTHVSTGVGNNPQGQAGGRAFKRPGGFAEPGEDDPSRSDAAMGMDAAAAAASKSKTARAFMRPGGFAEPGGDGASRTNVSVGTGATAAAAKAGARQLKRPGGFAEPGEDEAGRAPTTVPTTVGATRVEAKQGRQFKRPGGFEEMGDEEAPRAPLQPQPQPALRGAQPGPSPARRMLRPSAADTGDATGEERGATTTGVLPSVRPLPGQPVLALAQPSLSYTGHATAPPRPSCRPTQLPPPLLPAGPAPQEAEPPAGLSPAEHAELIQRRRLMRADNRGAEEEEDMEEVEEVVLNERPGGGGTARGRMQGPPVAQAG